MHTPVTAPRVARARMPPSPLAALATQLCVALVALAYALVFHANVKRWHLRDDVFFTERDPTLSYPNRASTVPTWVLGVTSSLAPAAAVAVAHLARARVMFSDGSMDDGGADEEAAAARSRARREGSLVMSALELLGVAQAVLFAMGTYNAIKGFARRPRPNFFAACDYKGGVTLRFGCVASRIPGPRSVTCAQSSSFVVTFSRPDSTDVPGRRRRRRPLRAGYRRGLESGNLTAYLAATAPGSPGDVEHCLAPGDEVEEALLSFPSGHAALSFAGMTCASLALASAARTWSLDENLTLREPGNGPTERQASGHPPRGVSPAVAAAWLPLVRREGLPRGDSPRDTATRAHFVY